MTPKFVAHYRIETQIGQGGMGVVYRAFDTKLNRTVALKVLPANLVGDEEHRARFLQEALSAAAVSHPYIAAIHEAGEDDGTLYIVMEYVTGQPMTALIKSGALKLNEALRLCTEVAEGMAKAHEQNIIHRDLKPDNIMVTEDGHAKILDFGLAKLLSPEDPDAIDQTEAPTAAAGLTMAGEVMGTPSFMSPEQARGESVDARSDVFSFGAIFYEALTGRRLFQKNSLAETLSAILSFDPFEVPDPDVRLPGRIGAVLQKALQKDAGLRYANGSELVADLQALRDDPGTLTSLPLSPSRPQSPRLKRLLPLLSAVLLGALGLWAILEFGRGDRTAPARAPVAQETPELANWILVSHFKSPPEQEPIADAARQLVMAALTESDFVTPISDAQMRRGLRIAGQPADTTVVDDLARELAVRAAAETYVEGSINQVANRYSIVLNVTAVGEGRTVASARRIVPEDSLLIACDQLGRQLREDLGEVKSVVAQTQPLRETITPSFEAFRLYVRAGDLQGKREFAQAIPLLQEALRLDPEFALGLQMMGTCWGNLGEPDSAAVAFDRALALRDRLTEYQRLSLQSYVASLIDHDYTAAIEFYDRMVALKPRASTAHNERARILFNLGRYEEALDSQRRLAELRPFGPSRLHYNNQILMAMQVGRYDEAEHLSENLSTRGQRSVALKVASARADWARVESLATAYLQDEPRGLLKFESRLSLITVDVVRGRLSRARDGISALAPEAPNDFYANLLCMASAQLWLMEKEYTRETRPAAVCDGNSLPNHIVSAIVAAASGSAGGRAHLDSIRTASAPSRRQHASDIRLAEAWLLASQDRWREVVDQFNPFAFGGQGPWFCGRIPMRWLLARAHQELGEYEKAAAAYEAVLNPTRMHHDTWSWWGIARPFALAKLIYLHENHIDAAKASEYRTRLQQLMQEPDTALLELIPATAHP